VIGKIRYFESLVVACVGFGLAGSALATEWQMVEESSAVTFSALQQGARFRGRFQSFDAKITFDPANPASGSVVGIVEPGSVNTRDHDRDNTLLDADWFNVERYPEARFESQRIEKRDDGSYRAHGELTLKGQTKPMTLDFTFDAESSKARFEGTMSINRFDFRVGEGWNDTSWIGERVNVEIALDLAR
jgi:polyisoprenoid-binding protein YceI